MPPPPYQTGVSITLLVSNLGNRRAGERARRKNIQVPQNGQLIGSEHGGYRGICPPPPEYKPAKSTAALPSSDSGVLSFNMFPWTP